jgi:hypothetical protein
LNPNTDFAGGKATARFLANLGFEVDYESRPASRQRLRQNSPRQPDPTTRNEVTVEDTARLGVIEQKQAHDFEIVTMTPRQFFEQIVRPNLAEFHADDSDMRHAYNAAAAVDALAAHIFVWCTAHATAEVAGLKDDSHYRAKLAAAHDDFRLLRDIAKAQKHVRLTQGTPAITGAAQISTRPVGFGEGPFSHGRYGGPPQVVVDIDATTMRYVGQIVDNASRFLESEMARLNI